MKDLARFGFWIVLFMLAAHALAAGPMSPLEWLVDVMMLVIGVVYIIHDGQQIVERLDSSPPPEGEPS